MFIWAFFNHILARLFSMRILKFFLLTLNWSLKKFQFGGHPKNECKSSQVEVASFEWSKFIIGPAATLMKKCRQMATAQFLFRNCFERRFFWLWVIEIAYYKSSWKVSDRIELWWSNILRPTLDQSLHKLWTILKFLGSEDLDILHLISVNIRGLIVICARMMEITRCKY